MRDAQLQGGFDEVIEFECSAEIGVIEVGSDPRLHLILHRPRARDQLLHQVVAPNVLNCSLSRSERMANIRHCYVACRSGA